MAKTKEGSAGIIIEKDGNVVFLLPERIEGKDIPENVQIIALILELLDKSDTLETSVSSTVDRFYTILDEIGYN